MVQHTGTDNHVYRIRLESQILSVHNHAFSQVRKSLSGNFLIQLGNRLIRDINAKNLRSFSGERNDADIGTAYNNDSLTFDITKRLVVLLECVFQQNIIFVTWLFTRIRNARVLESRFFLQP